VATLAQLGLPESRVCLAARSAGPAAADGDGAAAASPAQRAITWGGYRRPDEVTLEPDADHVGRLLADEAVERWLNRPDVLGLLGAGEAAVAGDAAGHPPSAARPARRLLEVELRGGGEPRTVRVLARSVGLGFFGYHAWLVAACLGDHVPAVLGIRDGILLSLVEPGRGALDAVAPDDLEDVAAYVADRCRRLSLRPRAGGRAAAPVDAAVRAVAGRLAPSGGALAGRGEAAVAGLLDRALRPARPSVVDGRMGPGEWLRRTSGGLLKLEYEARSLGVTDPVHDLAAAVVQVRLEPEEARELVEAYERLTGDVTAVRARLALHSLAAGWAELGAVTSLPADPGARAGREAYARELAVRETMLTRAVNGYLAGVLLGGGPPAAAAESDAPPADWAVALDGALETDRLGFECASPAGVEAVRVLLAHEQRVWCCTEQSLGELRERCETFGLAGGVAEGGSATWDGLRGEAAILVGKGARQALRRLRAALLDDTDVLVDPRYQHSLRLFRHTDGGRRAVDGDEVRRVMARHGVGGLDVVQGRRWTTVVAAGVSAAAALDRLRGESRRDAAPLHVVAGGPADLELLGAAAGRHAPASVDAPLRARAGALGLRVASRPHQAGLLQAVRGAVHGGRESCPRCQAAGSRRLDGADAALVTALGLQDRGRLAGIAFLLRRR
jgi:hypothetical protein